MSTREEIFTPKGVKPQWEQVYEVFTVVPVDTLVTYEELHSVLGWDVRTNRGPVYKAIQKLEERDHRTLAVMPGEGYRVARPQEHETLGKKHHRRARRQLTKSVRKFRAADRAELTPEQAARLDRLEMTTERAVQAVRSLDERTKRIQKAVEENRQEALSATADVDAKVERMREILAKHGITVPPT